MQPHSSRQQRRFHVQAILLAGTSIAVTAAVANGCSAEPEENCFGCAGGSTGTMTTAGTNVGGAGGATSSSSGDGGFNPLPDGGPDAPPDVQVNPCGTECGPTELCDPAHVGLDDDCDGLVDEICNCQAGQAHACFKGDPSYHGTAGCFDGTEKCTENGTWGPCIGGVHATPEEQCFLNNEVLCHPIQAVPFQDVNLKSGTGSFSANAVTETWEVACPAGVNPCPAVGGANPTDDFKPLQSGEYSVTYTKTVAGGPDESCTYPLFVGARGLRVELQWEWEELTADVDLHLHQPNDTTPWAIGGSNADCGFANCKASGFNPPMWFNGVAPPDPVNWYLDPVFDQNTCYFAPRGVGQEWQNIGMGCRNPRLDLDNIDCSIGSTNPDDFDFCAPENINVDYPPTDQWFRIGVHYYSSHGISYDLHPQVKIYCDGALAADLGSQGYYDPESPVTFAPVDGESFGTNRFWMVADVRFKPADECSPASCTVQPLHSDPVLKTPLLATQAQAEANFGPDYPIIP